ncbi:hypothetical protein OY671_010530, partial [Metschnikowia pulcherrima]
ARGGGGGAVGRAEREILAGNARDVAGGEGKGRAGGSRDRLRLEWGRRAAVADAVEQVASSREPVGEVIDSATRPNGMVSQRVRVPIGSIGIIYESRPNVTADAAASCVRSGNAVSSRGGSEAVHSNRAIHQASVAGSAEGGVPADAVQLSPTQDRAAVGAMSTAAGLIDMIVPRG